MYQIIELVWPNPRWIDPLVDNSLLFVTVMSERTPFNRYLSNRIDYWMFNCWIWFEQCQVQRRFQTAVSIRTALDVLELNGFLAYDWLNYLTPITRVKMVLIERGNWLNKALICAGRALATKEISLWFGRQKKKSINGFQFNSNSTNSSATSPPFRKRKSKSSSIALLFDSIETNHFCNFFFLLFKFFFFWLNESGKWNGTWRFSSGCSFHTFDSIGRSQCWGKNTN